jgi:two-component system response regulator YesN
VTVTIGVGRRYKDLESIPLSYAEASLARRHKLGQKGNTVIHIDDVHHMTDSDHRLPYSVQLEQDLLKNVRLNERQLSIKLMSDIIDYLLYESKKSPEAIRYRLAEIVSLVSRAVIEGGGPANKVLDISHKQLMSLPQRQGVAELRAWALNSLAELMAAIQVGEQIVDPIQQAVEYIYENRYQPGISLKNVADVVNLSPSHLAHCLKTRLGMSYMKYLTSLRIEQAKKLLRTTDLTVSTVAEKVGYQNTTNFYRLFQRETGMTPALYRQSS